MVSCSLVTSLLIAFQVPVTIPDEARIRITAISNQIHSLSGNSPTNWSDHRVRQIESRPNALAIDIGPVHFVVSRTTWEVLAISCDKRGPQISQYPGGVLPNLETIVRREFLRIGGEGDLRIDPPTIEEVRYSEAQHFYRVGATIWRAPGLREYPSVTYDIDALTSHPVGIVKFEKVSLPTSTAPAINYEQACQQVAAHILSSGSGLAVEMTGTPGLEALNHFVYDSPIKPYPPSFVNAKNRRESWLCYMPTFRMFRDSRLIGNGFGCVDAKNPAYMVVNRGGGFGGVVSVPGLTKKPWQDCKRLTLWIGRNSVSIENGPVVKPGKLGTSSARIVVQNDRSTYWLAHFDRATDKIYWKDGDAYLQMNLAAKCRLALSRLIDK